MKFRLTSEFQPTGDQPRAIDFLSGGIGAGESHQVLLGVTGSGKTFTIANVIENIGLPTLVIAPNKTLAAQLYSEFKGLFPENCVEYFVSYYDYYQPEAYLPATDTYIEKDASINEEIDKLRHSATSNLLTRKDVIVVASVSCIYGLGDPVSYSKMIISLKVGDKLSRKELLKQLVNIQYKRGDEDFRRGRFRVRGDVIDVFPASNEDKVVRFEFWDDRIEAISEVDPFRGVNSAELTQATIFPATHYVADRETTEKARITIRAELEEQVQALIRDNKLEEAHRLERRTYRDLELIEEIGFCPGIENYARHLDGRSPGEPPYTLLDYFPKPFLTVIDESHLSVPQLGGMYRGDRSRKETLIGFGFRLPSALDNRPLNFQEFQERTGQVIYVSATPGDYEYQRAGGRIAEQIIRPTGLMDPRIEVRPTKHQVDDVLTEIRSCVNKGYRVLITTLTKKMAEDLTEYLRDIGVSANYLHSDIDTLERIRIIRGLRLGEFDVLVGINLLREGLDLPEVVLVAILDADKEGFLRSERSLIQTCGRAARNVEGYVLMYADRETHSMSRAIEETKRRRRIQEAYNKKYGITPKTIQKNITDLLGGINERDYVTVPIVAGEEEEKYKTREELGQKIKDVKEKMFIAAKALEFEEARVFRDELKRLEEVFNKW